jgi:hypothetical protein
MVYIKTELMKLKVPALKIIASGKGIVHSGVKKADLVDRIIEVGDADCVAPKTRDPKTKKCVTKNRLKKVPVVACPEGQLRDEDANDCVDIVYDKTELMKLKVPALKIIASGKGIVHSGVKKENLVDKIIEVGDADCVAPKTRDPKTKKCVTKKKVPREPCPQGQIRDKDTNVCRDKKKGRKAPLEPCPEGQIRDKDTNDCRDKKKGRKAPLEPCPEGQIRDKDTNDCRDKKKGRKAPLEPCPEGQIRDKDDKKCRDKKRGKKAKVVMEDEVVAKDATCESILTSKGCDDKEITHDGFKLRECIWTNGDNSCKARTDNLEDRLQNYLGLNIAYFTFHVETLRVITKEVQTLMVADKLDFSKALQKYKKDNERDLVEKHDTYMKEVDKIKSMLKKIKKSKTIDEKSYRTLRDKLKEFREFSKDIHKSRMALNNGTVNLIEYIEKLKTKIGNDPIMQDNGDDGNKLRQGYIDLDQNKYKIRTMSVRQQPGMLLHIHDFLDTLVKSTNNQSVIDIRDSLFKIPDFSEWMRLRQERITAAELEKQIESEPELEEDMSAINGNDDFGGGDDQPDYSAMPLPFKDNNKGGTLTKKPKKYEDDESSDDDSGVRDKSSLDESFRKNLKALETDYLTKGIFPDKFSNNQDERFLATWIILISRNREMERGSMQDERTRKIWDDLTNKYQSLFNPEESDESEDEKPPSPPRKINNTKPKNNLIVESDDEESPSPPRKIKKPKPKKTVVVESDDEESEPIGASQAYYGLYEYSDKYDGDKSKRKFSIIKVVDTDTTDKRLLPSGLGCTSFTGAKKAEIDSLVKKLYSITKEFGKPPTKRLAERCDWIEKVMESLGLIMRDTNL